MARFNEILAGRYNRYLQKLFQLKGGPPAAQLASEVMPVFQFFTGVENRVLEGWHRYGLLMSITAGAATNSLVRLRNPITANVIAVMEKLTVSNNTAGNVIYAVRSGNLSAADAAVINVMANTGRWDSRGQLASVLIISSNSASVATPASPGSTKVQGNALVGTAYDFINTLDQEMLILPGDAVDVLMGTPAVSLDVSWTWRERALEDSEQKA